MASRKWQRQPRNEPPPPPPPLFPADLSIPQWEDCFGMSWKDFCKNKKAVNLFSKVKNWDNSAGEEALDNAKARFLAKINRLPCGIPLQDPDIFNNLGDDSEINIGSIEDLLKTPPPAPRNQIGSEWVDFISTRWCDEGCSKNRNWTSDNGTGTYCENFLNKKCIWHP